MPSDLREAYPFTSHYLPSQGGQLHYIDEGPRDQPVVVCVHGNPTWSFYWRHLILQLRQHFRVVAPDHIGCGLSDKPQQFSYRLKDHVANLEHLLDHLGITRSSLVVHDWGGAIGIGWAIQHPERVQSLVVTNTAAFRSPYMPLSIRLTRAPGLGPLLVRGCNAFARAAIYRATARGLPRLASKGLLFPYNSWANRIGTLRFVQDIPMNEQHPSWSTLKSIEEGLVQLGSRPMLVLWGEADWCFTPWFRDQWKQRFPRAEVHSWAKVGHYLMEDAPDQAADTIHAFLAKNDSPPHA